jgi:hypothetical protein
MTITLLDIAKANGSDMVAGLIDETTKAHPELTLAPARTIQGIMYKTLVRTGLPTVAFRDANQGQASTKASHENRLVETFILNPRWHGDKAVADRYEDGAPAYLAMEASAHMEASMQLLASQFYYGRTLGDAKGYPGLLQAYSTTMEVDAAGTTASTGSSVWAVKFGPKDVIWVWGNNGELAPSEVSERDVEDAAGNNFTAYFQELLAYPGLQVGSTRAIGRIKDLTADNNCTLTDDMIADLLSKFEVGMKPDALFMNRRSLKQLQQSRTATNPTGAPAPFPQDSFGIPIAVTDAITSTETLT